MTCSGLSKTAKLDAFSIIEACRNVKSYADFAVVFEKISLLMGQEMGAYGIGDVRTMKVISNFNAGFSSEFMAAIVDSSGRMTSPLLQRWLYP